MIYWSAATKFAEACFAGLQLGIPARPLCVNVFIILAHAFPTMASPFDVLMGHCDSIYDHTFEDIDLEGPSITALGRVLLSRSINFLH
jgi:hypothetical protein